MSINSWATVTEKNYEEKVKETQKYGPLRLKLGQVMSKIFDEIGVIWYLDCGSLMGAYRDGKMLPHDDDFDFGVLLPEVEFEDLMKKIESKLPEPYKIRMTNSYCKKLEAYDPNHGIYLFGDQNQYDYYNVSNDVQLYCPQQGSDDVKCMYFKNKFYENNTYKKSDIQPRGQVTFEGVKFKCPGNPAAYLTVTYGYIGKNARFNAQTQKYEKKPEQNEKV